MWPFKRKSGPQLEPPKRDVIQSHGGSRISATNISDDVVASRRRLLTGSVVAAAGAPLAAAAMAGEQQGPSTDELLRRIEELEAARNIPEPDQEPDDYPVFSTVSFSSCVTAGPYITSGVTSGAFSGRLHGSTRKRFT